MAKRHTGIQVNCQLWIYPFQQLEENPVNHMLLLFMEWQIQSIH